MTYTFARAEQAIKTFTEIRDARQFDEEASLICAVAEIEEAEAVRRKEQASELADRIVAGFMSPALATPASDWHVRYRLPYANADYVVPSEPVACPACKKTMVQLQGGEMTHDHDTYDANVHCSCGAKLGQLRVEVSTIFGIEEDGRVLHGRCRVY